MYIYTHVALVFFLWTPPYLTVSSTNAELLFPLPQVYLDSGISVRGIRCKRGTDCEAKQ